MSRMQRRGIAFAMAGLALAWVAAGNAQDTGKRVGEKLDEVGRDIKDGLNRAGDAAKNQFQKAKASVHSMGVESRVYGRIHWDKALTDATIDLATTADGVITLNGSVADARAKTRAVELARETVGVTQVIDQLAIKPEASTVTPSKP